MKSAIITGGTSFIGAGLVDRLLRDGVECYAIVRPESKNFSALPAESSRLHLIRGNASIPEEWKKQVPACDAFFHFAWHGVGAVGRADPDIQKRNVEMALDCLRASAEVGCKRFVFAGSQAEYGICDDMITEQTPCNPVIEYGKGKLEVLRRAKELSRKLGVEYAHLRIFSVYGPGDHAWTLVSKCLDVFSESGEVELSPCTQKWNFLYLEDAAEAIERFGDCPLSGNDPVYNVAGEETRPLKEYVEMMREACGGGSPRYGKLENAAEAPHGIWPDIHRMLEVTGWRMRTDFAAGIRKTLEARERRI